MQESWVMKDRIRLDIEGGGIFSKMMLAIQNIEKYEYDLSSCYFNIADSRAINLDGRNPLDSILQQTRSDEYNVIKCKPLVPYNNIERIDKSSEYLNLKHIASQLKYKPELLVLVDDYTYLLGIRKSTVGVHIRLCDMNLAHGKDYGILTFNDYVEAIKKELNYSDANVFVASDNEESILKLKQIFGNRISFIPKLIRAKTEIEDSSKLQEKNFKSVRFWQEAFLETLLLSRCSKLICRTSNLANMAIINSNTFKEIIML